MKVFSVLFYLFFLFFTSIIAFPYSGRVLNHEGQGIRNAFVTIRGTTEVCTTNTAGEFGDAVTSNPFKSSAKQIGFPTLDGNYISYYASTEGILVSARIYSLRGRLIREYNSQSNCKGINTIAVDLSTATDCAIYIIQVTIGKNVFVNKSVRNTSKSTLRFNPIKIPDAYSEISTSSQQNTRAIDSLHIYASTYAETTFYAQSSLVGNITLLSIKAPDGMVWIPSRNESFSMGLDSNGFANEKPSHIVTFTYNFWIDSVEVTQGKYNAIMRSYDNYTKPKWMSMCGLGYAHPAYDVNWYNAILYCNAKSKKDGLDTVYSYDSICPGIWGGVGCSSELYNVKIDYSKIGYRLPTEAEWEYAYRAKTKTEFPWGYLDSDAFGWNSYNSNKKTHPVGKLLPNGWGLYDMGGNVTEWCNDVFVPYTSDSLTDPIGPEPDTSIDDFNEFHISRPIRGGSSFDNVLRMRSRHRTDILGCIAKWQVGFRVVLQIK